MNKITEEHIFDLIDGNLTEDERSEILRDLPKFPEMEALYRSLLMTEGYIKSHALEKPSVDFTERVSGKLNRIITQKKRNGILYRALSLVGIVTIASIAGVFAIAETLPGGPTSPISDSNIFISLTNQVEPLLSLMSTGLLKNLAMILFAFTFFVFMDRVLMRHFSMRN